MKKALNKLFVFLGAVALFSVLTVFTVSAETHHETIYNGAVYTVNVGDTLELLDPRTDSSDIDWFLIGTADNILDFDGSSSGRSVAVKTIAPGTARVNSCMTVTTYVQVPYQRYDVYTNKWYTDYRTEMRKTEYDCYVTIKVLDSLAPEITKQPKGVAAEPGKKATVKVSATDHSALSYQWYIKDAGNSSYSKSSITASSYSVTMNKDRDGRKIYCIITDSNGNKTKSKTVTMSMIDIIKQPVDQLVDSGTRISVTTAARGSSLAYQWYFKNKGSSSYKKSSITGKTYSIVADSSNTGRSIYCLIKDKHGNTIKTDTVTIRIRNYVKIKKQPVFDVAAAGKTVSATVEASGDGLKYQWYYKNPGASGFSKSSITESTYSFKIGNSSSGRQVYCVVKDKYGTCVKTDTIMFSILDISRQPVSAFVLKGETASVFLNASGSGLTYQWYYKDTDDTTYKKSSLTTNTYSVKMSSAKDGRKIYCLITNKFGHTVKSKTVSLNIQEYVSITQQPQDVLALEGDTATVTVKASGDGLTYCWYYKDMTDNAFIKSNITSNKYSVIMDQAKYCRNVYCVVTDQYGNRAESRHAVLSIPDPLAISDQPTHVGAQEGKKATVAFTTTGSGPLTYQWYYQNPKDTSFKKSSVTSSKYAVTMSSTNNGRKVYCVVSDSFGRSCTSKTFTLELIQPLTITNQPDKEYTGKAGSFLTISVTATGTGTIYYQWFSSRDADPWVGYSSTPNTYGSARIYFAPVYLNYESVIYRCEITDSYGQKIYSEPVRIITVE